jgi:hypothetical protein
MSAGAFKSVLGSGITALPWCCIAPAAFAVSGLATAGVGTTLRWATPAFMLVSILFLARALYLALIRRQGPKWVRAMVMLSTPAVALAWAFRFGVLVL